MSLPVYQQDRLPSLPQKSNQTELFIRLSRMPCNGILPRPKVVAKKAAVRVDVVPGKA
jgi:hypothetical protein